MGNVVHRFTLGSQTDVQLGIQLIEGTHDPIIGATRDMFLEVGGKAGTWDFGADIAEKRIRLPIAFVDCTTQTELQTAIRNLANHLLDSDGKPEEMELSFTWDANKYYTVRYSGTAPIERKVETGEGVLEFVSTSPFAHSTTTTTQATITSDPQTVTVTHSGTVKSPCTITLRNNSGASIAGFTIKREVEE